MDFFQTVGGRDFIEKMEMETTEISKTLNRIATALEKNNELREKELQMKESEMESVMEQDDLSR